MKQKIEDHCYEKHQVVYCGGQLCIEKNTEKQ